MFHSPDPACTNWSCFVFAFIESPDEDKEKKIYLLPVTDHDHSMNPRRSLSGSQIPGEEVKIQLFSSAPIWLTAKLASGAAEKGGG